MSELNLYQKLVELRRYVSEQGLSKDKQGFNYSYVTGNQILSKISNKMAELNLLLIPASEPGEWSTHEYKNKRGDIKTDFIVMGAMKYTWINADDPEETLDCNWAYYGQQDDVSRAYGSGLTYAERYYLLKVLGVATDSDDPDNRYTEINKTSKKETSQPKKDKKKYTPLEVTIKSINELRKMKNVDAKEITTFIKEKFNKSSSNELTFDEAVIVQKMLADKK